MAQNPFPPDQVEAALGGRYKIRQELRVGGQGAVFRAVRVRSPNGDPANDDVAPGFPEKSNCAVSGGNYRLNSPLLPQSVGRAPSARMCLTLYTDGVHYRHNAEADRESRRLGLQQLRPRVAIEG